MRLKPSTACCHPASRTSKGACESNANTMIYLGEIPPHRTGQRIKSQLVRNIPHAAKQALLPAPFAQSDPGETKAQIDLIYMNSNTN
jgi:hypothetical protein